MFIYLLLVLFASASSLSFAEWKVINQVIRVDTKDPEEIAANLPLFTDLQNRVVARGLVHKSKMVVDHLQGELNLVKWENDADCSVPDPNKVPVRNVIPFASVDFYFIDNPEQHHGNIMQELLLPPCGLDDVSGKSTKSSQY